MANGTGYSAGNLEFSVQQISNATISSLDRLIEKLQTTMNLLGSVSSLTKNLGTTVGKGTGGGAFSKTKDSSTYRTVGGKTYLQQSTEMKMLGSEIVKVTTKFNEQGKVLKTTTTSIDEYGKKIVKIVDNSNKKLSAFKLSDLLNKIYFIRTYTKQMFRSLVGIVKNAVEYTETLNLWQVAMRGNTQEAEEFIKTMNKGYGIATQTLMQYQAIFRNMLSSLGGISSDTSYALSEYLTQMALDYASLYNTSIEKAMTTFQSVLSGQVRPIRSIAGYDITETTIYQLYQQLGGTKTMRQLSQTEKRLLRIYAVFQQMESSGAVGDLAKTMESTANQMRVFSESAKELGTWVGILLEHYLKPILPVLNAVTITLTNIVKAIAQMKGIKPQEFGVVESVEQLNEELDKTQGKLLSFDRFEALNSGAGEDNALGIDEKLLAGLSKYESIMGSLGEETQRLVDKWAEFWFVGGDYTKGLTEQGEETLDILKKIGGVIVGLVGLGITKRLINLLIPLKEIKDLMKLSFGSWKNFGITALITALGYLYTTNEDFRKSVNTLVISVLRPLGNILNAISPALTNLLNITVEFVTPIIDIVSELIKMLDKFGLLEGAVYLVVGAFATFKGLQLINYLSKFNGTIGIVATSIKNSLGRALGLGSIGWELMSTKAKAASLAIGGVLAVTLYSGLNAWFDTMDSKTKMIAGSLTALIATITAATVAWMAFHGTMSMGVAVPVILGAVGAGVAGVKAIIDGASQYKNGGLVEDGLFQMSKGEIVGDFADGTTVVANNQQIISGIQQGVYSAVVSAMRQTGNNSGIGDVYLDGRKVGQTTSKYSHQENVRIGLVRATR